MKYEELKLENQLCFPLYVASKEIVRRYKPYLDKLDLTYTQYITMMVMWEEEEINVRDLGERLFLDSGTLTPLLRTLEAKGLVDRGRWEEDERVLLVTLTSKGKKLQDKAKNIPSKIKEHLNISATDQKNLYKLINKLIENID